MTCIWVCMNHSGDEYKQSFDDISFIQVPGHTDTIPGIYSAIHKAASLMVLSHSMI